MSEHSFSNFVVYSLSKEKYNDHCLVKAGVIAVGDILEATGDNFSKYSPIFLPLLEKILVEEDIKRDIKLNVITLIGKICFKIGKNFIAHLDYNMKVIIGACELALLKADDDFEMEEYLQNLRQALVSTFTLIFFGLDDAGEAAKFEFYIEHIFRFYTSLIADDSYSLQPETLKGMLGFIMDMISTVGRNIKQVLDPNVPQRLLQKLRDTGLDKLIAYAKESEEVSLLINIYNCRQ